MHRIRLLAVLCAGALTIAACSTDESSAAVTDPNTTLPAPPTSTTTTTIPPTTTTSTTTTTTTSTTQPPAPTTTFPPPSGVPSAAPVPLIVGGAGSGGWLELGEWTGTGWQPPPAPPPPPEPEEEPTPLDPLIPPGTALAIIGLQAGATGGETGAPALSCVDLRSGPTVDSPVAVPAPPGFGYSALALPTPTWELQPRPVVVITTDIPSYQAAGEAAFADADVDATQGEVEQIMLADLDGDGDEEALVVFEHVDPTAATGAPGDLAAVVAVDTSAGSSAAIEGNFVADDAPPDPVPIIARYRIIDVADLNGDGLMEVVVHRWLFDAAGVVIYTYDGSTFTEALSAACGA